MFPSFLCDRVQLLHAILSACIIPLRSAIPRSYFANIEQHSEYSHLEPLQMGLDRNEGPHKIRACGLLEGERPLCGDRINRNALFSTIIGVKV
jgi:hypothetical protein